VFPHTTIWRKPSVFAAPALIKKKKTRRHSQESSKFRLGEQVLRTTSRH
jgi:hypothetical protein